MKSILFNILVLASTLSIAQTNTFPTSGNVGIGTSSPTSKLQVSGGSSNWNETIQGLSTGSIHLDPENSSDHFGSAITFGASDTSNGESAQAGIYVRSDGNYGTKMYFATTNAYVLGSKTAMLIDQKGKIGIGTTTPDSKLTVKGKIHAEEVKVDLSVPAPDYVFTKEYELLTIEEVQQHIKENGHLPNVPSATEMEINGVDLGVMNMKLLEKIEELTLYTIDQKQELKKQQEKLKFLEDKLTLLLEK